ncbi:transcriptional regulator YfiE [Escherichia coli]|uniref:Transcriptional regulator YfiE n=1 Tax=Escherichia coli TaxID=562 RepID=A0A2X1MTL5_ECOLX|nr:transcriptional regulator YfiE [Escherichia coli]STM09686.1 transcriptional regulator YfiE [Escherichia coli]
MDLRRFITLKTVVEEGSFLRASQKLCCTQSTVTFHIQQLEQEFSVQLFEKIGRRMCLTREGKKLLPHIYELTRVMDILREAAKKESDPDGELRVVSGETVAFLPNTAGVAAFSATRTKSAFIVAVSELLRDP